MKRRVVLWAGAAMLLVSVAYSEQAVSARAAVEQRMQERALISELFLGGRSREALERLLAMRAPAGVSKDLFLVRELTRLCLSFRNAQEPEAAARVASITVDLLKPELVLQLPSRADRAETWRALAMIHEEVLPDQSLARAAWQLAMIEAPEDERASRAIRKIDERAAHAARVRDEIARDPMGPGFTPNPVPPAVKP